MVSPDPAYRITAMQAYHHPALQPVAPSVVITPHFVRAAASFEMDEVMSAIPASHNDQAQNAKSQGDGRKEKDAEKKRRKKKRETKEPARAATPALGESIKQHTSVPRKAVAKVEKVQRGQEESQTPSPKKGSKVIIKKAGLLGDEDGENKGVEEDPTRE
jgi:hypothetical protein